MVVYGGGAGGRNRWASDAISAASPGTCNNTRSFRVYVGRRCAKTNGFSFFKTATRVCPPALYLDLSVFFRISSSSSVFVVPFYVQEEDKQCRCTTTVCMVFGFAFFFLCWRTCLRARDFSKHNCTCKYCWPKSNHAGPVFVLLLLYVWHACVTARLWW